MKILLDENLPHELRSRLPAHDVFTVAYLNWEALENGALLRQAALEKFDVMITLDQGVQHQQNLQKLPIAVLVIRA